MQKRGEIMQYVIVVFSSRNETLYLANMLLKQGYKVPVVNTPTEMGRTCGISVQINESLLPMVKKAIASAPFRSFFVIFKIIKNGSRISIIKL